MGSVRIGNTHSDNPFLCSPHRGFDFIIVLYLVVVARGRAVDRFLSGRRALAAPVPLFISPRGSVDKTDHLLTHLLRVQGSARRARAISRLVPLPRTQFVCDFRGADAIASVHNQKV